jgi:hypothetical protein
MCVGGGDGDIAALRAGYAEAGFLSIVRLDAHPISRVVIALTLV